MKIFVVVIGIFVVSCIAAIAILGKSKPVDKSGQTYSGKINDYSGNKKLIVAFTASWASVWIVTGEEIKKIDKDRFDLLILDSDVDKDEFVKFKISHLPTVALFENGVIIKKYQNLMNIDQITDW